MIPLLSGRFFVHFLSVGGQIFRPSMEQLSSGAGLLLSADSRRNAICQIVTALLSTSTSPGPRYSVLAVLFCSLAVLFRGSCF